MPGKKSPGNRAHLFQPGQSGNPRGKPKGVQNKKTAFMQKLAQDASGDVMRAMIEEAKGGDTAAAKIVLERAILLHKPTLPTVKIPGFDKTSNPTEQAELINKHVADGELAADLGEKILLGVRFHQDLLDREDLLQRLEKLEAEAAAKV